MYKVSMVSLGCPKNQVDAEMMLATLKNAGFEIGVPEAEADAIIINTCGFIESAKQESINEILELSKLKEEGKIKKVYSEDKAVYETIKKTHYHFECQLCHKIIDIDPSLINIKINHSITGVTKKDLFLYGICDECKNKKEN